ncbi:hypothetical protein B0H10DRAFT_1937952 [Mycena sp. CBHHK59/15]|nr:hypothetical protein B0H10DRAFT_1937952 [Mycena sp. CBHHK59/15]
MTFPKKAYLISTCFQAETNTTASKRAAAKATATSNTTASQKRRRTSIASADGRPTTRPRTDPSSDDDGCGTHTPYDDHDEEPESDNEDLGNEDDGDIDMVETFSDAESFAGALRADFKTGKAMDFHGAYPVPVDPLVSLKERVQMVATEIWKISGYRFTVKDHQKLKTGHRARFWCSQDEARKKKSKSSQSPDV